MTDYIIRANENYIFSSFERPFVSALLGSRRVGKSTLIDHYMKLHRPRKWAYFNMDKFNERERIANHELAQMIEEAALTSIAGSSQKIWVVIDEAQKCPALFDQVKLLYDAYKGEDKLKFILTGSAHLNLHQLTTESLAGRVDLLHLREFNLREMMKIQQPDINVPTETAFNTIFGLADSAHLQTLYNQLRPFNKVFQRALEFHLIWGGLPEVLQEPDDGYRLRYLSNYLQTYLEKDIRAIDTISDLTLYHHLLKICAEQTGSLRDDKKIIDALHASRNTINKYRDYLQATLQYTEIYPYIDSTIKRMVKSPKGYVINNGLISYLTGIHQHEILQTTGLIGHRLENWFLNELLTWQDTSPENHGNYFWRTAAGAEVDFVAVSGDRVVPFEVTYTAQIQNHKVKHLRSFMQDEPKTNHGIYVYNGDFKIDTQNNIIFLPVWML